MGGKKKSQTTGFWYRMGLHMGLCHAPVDAFLEIRGGDRTAWQGEVTESGSIGIDAANLYGGSEREGGIYGQLDVMMGEPTQAPNSYLAAKIGAGRPAYRGILGLVFRGSGGTLPAGNSAPKGTIAANNPYIKPWAFRVRRILQGWKGGTAWYAAKAPVVLFEQYDDVYSANVLSLLHADSFNGDTTFIDDGLDAGAWQAAPSYISTTQSKFGGSSFRTFNGSNYLASKACSTTWAPNAPYTAEGWFYYDGTDPHLEKIFFNAHYNSGALCLCELTIEPTTHNLRFDVTSSGADYTGVPMPINQWVHLAVSSTGSMHYLYLDGVKIGELSGVNTAVGTLYWSPMKSQRGGALIYGYMDEVRLTYGVSRYPGGVSFTPPASAHPNPYATSESSSLVLKAMNPAHIVYECLTNSEWGMGYDSSIIDDASFTAAADTFHAEGLGLCLLWNRQDSIENFIKIIMDHCGAVMAEDRTTGLIKLKPIRADYDIGTLPEFGSELGNVLEMIRFERGAVTDAINEVTVSYTDSATGKVGSVTVHNLAAVQASGRVISQSVDYPGIPTMDLALRTALRDLTAFTSGLARVQLTLNRSGYALIPGDVIKFSWTPDGISQMILRVITIDYGSLTDGKISVECLEDVFGLPATTYVSQQTSGWVAPDATAQASTAVAVFEAPYRELIGTLGRAETQALADESGYVAGIAARAPGFNLNYKLYTRIGAAAYADAGAADWCPTGTLQAAITPISTSIILNATDGLDLIEVGTAAMLGSGATAEIVRVEAVNVGTSTITIARGCLDTVPKAWAIATRFWAYDEYSAGAVSEYTLSEVVDSKFLTNTPTDLLAESSAPGASLTLAQRQVRPYPPAKLRFDDVLASAQIYPALLYGAITTSWAHRDRLLQDDQIIDTEAATIGPEPSTTYTVRYYQPANTLVNTQSAISGAAATAYTFAADGTARITVEALRAGYGSWQLQDHTFSYFINAPYDLITELGDNLITELGDTITTE